MTALIQRPQWRTGIALIASGRAAAAGPPAAAIPGSRLDASMPRQRHGLGLDEGSGLLPWLTCADVTGISPYLAMIF